MFRSLHFRTRYGSYLRNEHGIKKFAELSIDQLTRKVTKKSAFYREMNENMLVEKANLRLRADEFRERPMLDPGEFFSVRRRLWANASIVFAVLVASIFLNYISISAFIDDGMGAAGFLRWFASGVFAVVLTGGGIIVAERLIESIMPRRRPLTERLRDVDTHSAPLWGLLLAGILLAVLGLAEVRAEMLSTSQGSGILYYGFIALMMLLPIIAGAIRWDAMQYIDVYKTTQALHQIEARLAQIDSILRQNEEYESNFYKLKSISYWDLLNEFKTLKDNYNQKHGAVENLHGHYAQTYDTFMAEANKRYQEDIRDITSKSIRKLELVNNTQPAGSKIGQQKSGSLQIGQPVPPASQSDSGADTAANLYLSPQPIR